ncbi:hypothetical protein ACFOG5_22345 [Pedobacter fastidiosus]|uniref:Uncharacterized protein n=1 Tax=Pedobacter fastidiosus TaxID=2765361 RepID=A0ABR7KN63_9SPHI|nr:hypothetical protein [Pedobacter fastidiosus]MBC6109519.1 hypothetical protein [Pedobacter fastidiosus]
MKKKQITLMIFVFVFIPFGVWCFFLRKEPISKVGFIQQGITTINGKAEIKLYDSQAIDGDTVDFYFDGKLIFKKLGLSDTARVYYTGKLSKGEHWIGIKAVTEGFNPPATPHIGICDGKNTIDFDIESFRDSTSGSWILNVK